MTIAAAGGPSWTDIMSAFGTVGAVVVALGIALWTACLSKKERERALKRDQEAAANAVQVALVAAGPGDKNDRTWILTVLVVNHSPFVITGVDARIHTRGQELIETAMREKVPGSHRLGFELLKGMSSRAEALADTGTLGPWDDGIRFQSDRLDTNQVAGAYPVARWTDRWGTRWECKQGVVRRINDSDPWEP